MMTMVMVVVVVLGRRLNHVAATLVVVIIVSVTLQLQWKHCVALATEHTKRHRGSDDGRLPQCDPVTLM